MVTSDRAPERPGPEPGPDPDCYCGMCPSCVTCRCPDCIDRADPPEAQR